MVQPETDSTVPLVPIPTPVAIPPRPSLEKCCETSLSWQPFQGSGGIDYRGSRTSCLCCQKRYEHNAATGGIYVKAPDAECFSHLACGTDISIADVAHSIWERGTCAGWGEVVREAVPFCPNCEPQPQFHGRPVYYKAPVIRDDGAIDRAATDGWEL